ncbi:MAG: aminopeptidase [Peptoniphilus harei]|uniref:aminopeptidase n=1 Tax=Peptoniphilus harei TaxID=54005 RepID=UPI00254CCE01|nr:aminopeptidase [Peptoniphilus harei]MDK7755391.1 aminopeptidase [Peptoniphilus harei]MDK7761626.1 aminopeptidase [Peptoniphilus harei]MDK8271151.1 aminopeptidase [Peptoniphilus harei]MDK8339261.1 aminopeptidase [Peptoniphilus harei]
MDYKNFKVEDYIEKYVELILKVGLKIKNGDKLVVRCPIEARDFAVECTRKAYELGAGEVVVDYRDQLISRLKYENESLGVLTDIPKHKVDKENYYMEKKAKYLSVTGSDPDAFKGVDSEKLFKSNLANSKALRDFSAKMMANYVSWIVVGASIPSWAAKVFPDLEEGEAVRRLWFEIFNSVRLFEEDPIKALENHVDNLNRYSKFLNDAKFEKLIYKSQKGTDLEVGLPKGYIFAGAGDVNSDGEEFIANMPSEEVFSAPRLDGVNGKVYSTLPLNYNGNLIEDFYLVFKDGEVVDYDAKAGKEYLKNILDTDEGAKRLGEVALVSYNTPISMRKVLFYNTLYDENASCHFALGKSYPTCLEGGEKLSIEELKERGMNDSLTHVDFMVGDETTEIIGVKENGDQVQIFKEGNFVI